MWGRNYGLSKQKKINFVSRWRSHYFGAYPNLHLLATFRNNFEISKTQCAKPNVGQGGVFCVIF